MPRKEHKVVVDGVTYYITKADPFAAMKLVALGRKFLGPGLRAFSTAKDMKGMIGNLLGKDGESLALLLDSEITPALFDSLADLADSFADKLTEDDLIKAVNLVLVGNLAGPLDAQPKFNYEDEDTYLMAMSEQIEKHGHMHQLRLLWAALRVNLGPISAGSPTSSRKDAEAPAQP